MTDPSAPVEAVKPARDPWRVVTVALAALSVIWLGYELWRLVLQPARESGAVDLYLRREEVLGWFQGEPIYHTNSNAVYPPASYLMLWPFVGWSSWSVTRGIWFFVSVATIAGLAVVFRRSARAQGSQAPGRWQWRALLVFPLASYPVGASLGNGQLGIAVTLCLMTGLPLLDRERSLGRDAAVVALVLLALVKPSVSAAFFWIVLLRHGSLRAALLVIGAYVALTLCSGVFQPMKPVALMKDWLNRGTVGSVWGATSGEGSIRTEAVPVEKRVAANKQGEKKVTKKKRALAPAAPERLRVTNINLHSLLAAFGHTRHFTLATLTVLLLLGVWVAWHRDCEIWVLIGATALVARFSSYHGWYDDVMLLPSLVALHRLSGAMSGARGRRVAYGLFLAMAVSLLAPGGVYLLPHPWNNVYAFAQAAVWITALGFLVYVAARTRVRAEVLA